MIFGSTPKISKAVPIKAEEGLTVPFSVDDVHGKSIIALDRMVCVTPLDATIKESAGLFGEEEKVFNAVTSPDV